MEMCVGQEGEGVLQLPKKRDVFYGSHPSLLAGP